VATLNIKNFPEALYRRLEARARKRRRSMAQEVTHVLEEALGVAEPLSILELRGLGKDKWRKVDAARHVARERRAWD
jgi:plasmid stability protein